MVQRTKFSKTSVGLLSAARQKYVFLNVNDKGGSSGTINYLNYPHCTIVYAIRLKMMYLFMAMMAWYQRCHRRRARIPFIHAVSSVCSTSTYTWTRGHQCVHQHTTICTLVQYVPYMYVNDRTTGTVCTTEYTVQQTLLSGVHSIIRVKLAQAGEGGGLHYIYHHQ